MKYWLTRWRLHRFIAKVSDTVNCTYDYEDVTQIPKKLEAMYALSKDLPGEQDLVIHASKREVEAFSSFIANLVDQKIGLIDQARIALATLAYARVQKEGDNE